MKRSACFSFLWIFLLLTELAWSQWGQKREPAAFSRVPQELNEKAIVDCLPKLKGFISSQETTSIDNLKTKIERIYGLKRPMMKYRELQYKNGPGEKWKVEFYLSPESRWSREKYKLKFFKAEESGFFVETASPLKDDFLSKDAVLKFAQYEQVDSDERWERFVMPAEPAVSYKSRDFKLYELMVSNRSPKFSLLCNMAGGHPYCQCSK
jgi:hypothetical protein